MGESEIDADGAGAGAGQGHAPNHGLRLFRFGAVGRSPRPLRHGRVRLFRKDISAPRSNVGESEGQEATHHDEETKVSFIMNLPTYEE